MKGKNNMKGNKRSHLQSILAGFILSLISLSACQDMLDTNSDRQAFDPDLGSKTDSVFYAFGIAQAMQQLADQYFFQGEMRGELITTTEYTDSMLTQLHTFSADLTNRYDSAYLYYRVINNCNYYIAHRDLTLQTGSVDVVMNEYAAVLAYRAWAYLQLCRNYGEVPFFTEPLTTISQIDNGTFDTKDIIGVTEALAPELLKYTKLSVPNYGTFSVGNTNHNAQKNIDTRNIFVPVGVVLGDLYLECGEYEKAAQSYVDYLIATKQPATDVKAPFTLRNEDLEYPRGMVITALTGSYGNIFSANASPVDVISYIPMAVNSTRGATTKVPYSFGYDYYSLTTTWDENIQLLPSEAYKYLTDNQTYFYQYNETDMTSAPVNNATRSGNYGDMRSLDIMRTQFGNVMLDEETEDIQWIDKFQSGNIILYRLTTVYLHLCEALNRMGMPDLAFCFLKEGINNAVAGTGENKLPWLTQRSVDYLQATFCSNENMEVFVGKTSPIHQHGCGNTSDNGILGSSPYQFDTQVDSMLHVLAPNAELYPGLASRLASATTTAADTIMAMEELLCDEEAMEFCFEGTRWYDLMRFAQHKNRAGLQGNAWLADKLKANQPTKSLLDQKNWYLPFKK